MKLAGHFETNFTHRQKYQKLIKHCILLAHVTHVASLASPNFNTLSTSPFGGNGTLEPHAV
jgi:hypothetical protein